LSGERVHVRIDSQSEDYGSDYGIPLKQRLRYSSDVLTMVL